MEQEIQNTDNTETVDSPILNPNIVMTNCLPYDGSEKNNVHVIITPSYDYALVEVLISFEKLVRSFGSLGSITNVIDLITRLRTLSLTKKMHEITSNVMEAMKENSITLRPGPEENVYNAFKHISMDITNLITRLGGKGLSIMVVTADLKKATIFNSALDNTYYVNEDGVSKGPDTELHAWNNVSFYANQLTDTAPCLVRLGDKLNLLYRSKIAGAEKRINIAMYDEGRFSSPKDHVLCGDKHIMDGVGATDISGKLWVAARGDGSNIFFRLYDSAATIPYKSDQPNVFRPFGTAIVGRPTATTINGRAIAVARSAERSKNVVIAIEELQGPDARAFNARFSTDYPPAICTFNDKLYIVCAEEVNGHMTIYSSTNGYEWSEGKNIPFDTSASPALVVYKGKMYIIYRHRKGTGVLYAWTDDGTQFREAPGGLSYIGFSSTCDIAAAPMPDENDGIMVAGLKPESWGYDDILTDLDFSFGHSEDAIIWTTFIPYSPKH